jgi:hypothetical protein
LLDKALTRLRITVGEKWVTEGKILTAENAEKIRGGRRDEQPEG